jgi:cell division protease FtsH
LSSTLKNIVFWVALFVLAALVWSYSTGTLATGAKSMPFSEFIALVQADQIQEVRIIERVTGNDVNGTTKANVAFRTYAPSSYDRLTNELLDKGIKVDARQETTSPWVALLYSWAPILLMIGFFIFWMRQMQSGARRSCRRARRRR